MAAKVAMMLDRQESVFFAHPRVMTNMQAQAGPRLGDMIDMKLLVLCPNRQDPNLKAICRIMDYIGIRYTVLATNEANLTKDYLWEGTHARYQGVVLSTGRLAEWNSAVTDWYDPLDDDEWNALRAYQVRFGIRLATFHGIPKVSMTTDALMIHEPASMVEEPLGLTLTDAGRQIFWYLNGNCRVPVFWGNAVSVTPMTIASTPLLEAADGLTYGAVWTASDGREYLALTFGHSDLSLHTLLLGYGVLNWVTRGVFLGQRKVTLSVQVDDIFNSNQLWDAGAGATGRGQIFRLTASDVSALVRWLDRVQKQANTHNLTLDFAFNGAAATPAPLDEAAVNAFTAHRERFRWINHGYTHLLLNDADQPESVQEIRRNHETARILDLARYEPVCMVTADMSGLTNLSFLTAAAACGVRFLVCDTSRPGWGNPSPNTPIPSNLQRAITLIPRHPNNLFYDVATPETWLAKYNQIYYAYWQRDLSLAQIIEEEAKQILNYLLVGDWDPLMFHQANLHAYDGTHSLLTDLLDEVLSKYDEYYREVPILSFSMRTIGEMMVKRAVYDQARIDASLVVGSGLILVADCDVDVPLTGVRILGANEKYGGQTMVTLSLKANVVRSIAAVDPIGYSCTAV